EQLRQARVDGLEADAESAVALVGPGHLTVEGERERDARQRELARHPRRWPGKVVSQSDADAARRKVAARSQAAATSHRDLDPAPEAGAGMSARTGVHERTPNEAPSTRAPRAVRSSVDCRCPGERNARFMLRATAGGPGGRAPTTPRAGRSGMGIATAGTILC